MSDFSDFVRNLFADPDAESGARVSDETPVPVDTGQGDNTMRDFVRNLFTNPERN